MERTGRSLEERSGVGGTEGGRSPTGVPPTPAASADGGASDRGPSPEVLEKPVRRRFTAEYKLRILEEVDRCSEPGQLGMLLRREGLYSSHLTCWRRQREQGMLRGLAPKRRGRKPKAKDPLFEENQRLQRENERLRAQLEKAETIINFQKKLSEILDIPLRNAESSENDE
jgi:transposase